MAGLSRTWCVCGRLDVIGVLSAVETEADQQGDYCQLMPNHCCKPLLRSDSQNMMLLFFFCVLLQNTM